MSLLFDKGDILLVNRKLASMIGLNEAIILQQLHYWLKKKGVGVTHEGCVWVFNTAEKWHEQFPFWSIDTVKRALAALRKDGFVKVDKLAEVGRDRTNYYTIDYAQIALLEAGKLHQSNDANCTNGSGQIAPMDQGKLHQSNEANCTNANKTKTTTKTTSKTTTKNLSAGAAPAADGPIVVAGPAFTVFVDKHGTSHEIPKELKYPGPGAKAHHAWMAYALAYRDVYGVWTLWNRKEAAHITQLIERVGIEIAPRVAYFYVKKVKEQFVVKKNHPLYLLVKDAEAYRNQATTGRVMTSARAAQIDQHQTVASVGEAALKLMREREGAAPPAGPATAVGDVIDVEARNVE